MQLSNEQFSDGSQNERDSPPKPVRACDGCRIRKRKCDAQKPYCGNCIKNTARDENGNPVCTYSQVQKKRGPKKGYKETLLQRLESLEAILGPLQKTGKIDQTIQWTKKQEMAEPILVPEERVDINEEEFELHLMRLGLQYCSAATNYRLSLLFGEDFQHHQKTILPCLRMALCAIGIFYSKHPYLETLLKKKIGRNRSSPVVKSYLKQAEKMLPVDPQNEYDLIDGVRAMLVIVDGYVSLGEPNDALRVNGDIHRWIEKKDLFHPALFTQSRSFASTVDDLRVEVDGGMIERYYPPTLSTADIEERFSLWEECLSVDTFTSMASGKQFELDETEYPLEFDDPALARFKNNVPNQFQLPPNYTRLCVPQSGRNSVWCGSVMAATFDDIREMTALAALHYSIPLVPYRLNLLRIIRRAMRFSRENAKGAAHRFPNDNPAILHSALLMQYENLPVLFLPFANIGLFAPYRDTSNLIINNAWRSFNSFNHDLLLFFAAFSYLHLPLVISNPRQKYPLSTANSTETYTSAQILVSVLRALCFIIQSLYTPIIGPAIQKPTTTIIENIQNGPLPEEIPSPGLCTMQSTVSIYIIATSAMVGIRSVNEPELQAMVENMVKRCIIPALVRVSHSRPFANQYFCKLAAILEVG